MNIAVITGASSGIGTEYARAVNSMYPDVEQIWIIARRENRLIEIAQNIGEKVIALPLDITDPVSIEKYKERLIESGANVKLLINNAGFGKLSRFDECDQADSTGMIRLNCEALTVMTAVTLPFMYEGGEIVNLCSIASFAPNTRMAVYSSTKAYVMSFSRALREELKTRKINVLAVCPGPMDTEFLSVANIEKGVSHTFDTLPRVNPRVMAVKSLKASKRHRAVYTNLLFFKFYRLLAKILPHSIVMKMCGT